MDAKAKKTKDMQLLKAYGITLARYEHMLAKQGGVCAICKGKNNTYGGKRNARRRWESLCVDHDHKTREIRGLLCHRCNRSIGNMRDNPELLQTMVEYLKTGTQPTIAELKQPQRKFATARSAQELVDILDDMKKRGIFK